eukprot:CAMPEP_0178959800 /NCGR_PEP_ID=MMETSP0789-20121207/12532_1 /TAXON_ID=3005 /ORGANISM="Rhizosolenia setigera, Strain CCMP 1694" /LENGTH=301 /DNA_ID=CAMNT_0020642923 /DNA_START=91 /DNA_END=996 /DNA_ORIENTATION=-
MKFAVKSLLFLLVTTRSDAFTIITPYSPQSLSTTNTPLFKTSSSSLSLSLRNDEEMNSSSSKKMMILNRLTDTLGSAGLTTSSSSSHQGLWDGGPKRMFTVLAILMTWKWIRAKFLLKQKVTDVQPAWGHVITSAEQEKVLHAYCCKQCGTTMFIAKGREIRFFNRFVECYNCGAKGKENFFDRREEALEHDDTDFEYENPMDYVSKAERKKLENQYGGDVSQMNQAVTGNEDILDAEVITEPEPEPESVVMEVNEEVVEEPVVEPPKAAQEEKLKSTPPPSPPPSSPSTGPQDDFDVLGI